MNIGNAFVNDFGSKTVQFVDYRCDRFFVSRNEFGRKDDGVTFMYFDAFGARVQPELWTENIFQKMYNALRINGVLVTYSAKGSVRRAMQSVGFQVEKLPGPPGKREMLRAIKN